MLNNWPPESVHRRLVPYSLLALVCLIYCWPALRAPLFGGVDLTSNLLPIVHFKRSIIQEGTLPLYTDLWYGGRAQWQNPLWSFLYFPATVFWLLLPLPWAARVIIVGHLVVSVWLGWEIARRFLDSRVSRIFAALLFLSPIIVRLERGHLEKIYAWPWILLVILAVLSVTNSDVKDGLIIGLSLAMIAHAGASYYLLYTIILLGFLGLSRLSKNFVRGIFAVAIPAMLLRLPSLLFMTDVDRLPVGFQLSFVAVLEALFLRIVDLESFSFIGLPILIMIVWSVAIWFRSPDRFAGRNLLFLCALAATAVFILMATGLLYQGHQLLDTFRVVSRTMAFAAVALLLAALIFAKDMPSALGQTIPVSSILLGVSAILALNNWWKVQPAGSEWLEQSGASEIVEYLSTEGAESVWLQPPEPPNRLVGIGLNQAGIALPDWYYGQMGQEKPTMGKYCGYSFDYLVTAQELDEGFALNGGTWSNRKVVTIHRESLELEAEFELQQQAYRIYRVICPEGSKQ